MSKLRHDTDNSTIESSFHELMNYCKSQSFKGYDPYDGLNSMFFRRIPFLPKIRLARLAWIQFFKRSPINLRKLVGIAPEYNPKSVGLFMSAYTILQKANPSGDKTAVIDNLYEILNECKSKGYSGDCWGYNFDWESRAFFQPKFTPTIVASSFIANAMMDAYDIYKDEKYLRSARSTCDFILNDLNRNTDQEGNFAFSYSPLDNSIVYNASLLGARLLARIYAVTAEKELYDASKKAVEFCCQKQKADGSWTYGTYSFHQWIDNFHTGYNLECISDYMKYTKDESYRDNLKNGFDYYINTFFTEEGVAKYYNDSVYPIDIHAPAQLVLTLHKLDKLDEYKEMAQKVLIWTIKNMKDKKGYFYYQKNKYFMSKIPYMRWSQAWMVLSLSVYLNHFNPNALN